ncbi:MAG: hypothetical protein OES78_07510 [Chromatiales bacterium]|nr:hypothetical protein [Chromatiales bacterium]MDH3894389.1 hypothetical protein [Chromatiales bacterium]MDH3932572.1 hypothetical protein [Chromatiales bacterium]
MKKAEEYRQGAIISAARNESPTAAAIAEHRSGWDAYEIWRARIRDEREKNRAAVRR